MTITIKFNDNIKHEYNSFDQITQLDNYDEIIYINWHNNKLSSLPQLPNSLEILWCSSNNLYCLPQLPISLISLSCYNNNLSSLPQLPKSLIYLYCDHNNLSSLPQLPNSLKELYCSYNNLSSLPQLPNSLEKIWCDNNPIYNYIKKYFNNHWKDYREFQQKIHNITMKVFANKIGEWYIECKYNPEYEICKKRLKMEFNELYCES